VDLSGLTQDVRVEREPAWPDLDEESLLDAVGTAFSRLRRRTPQVSADSTAKRRDLSRNVVVNAVDEADGELTVGGLAEQLTVDASVASRMVSDGIAAGYLVRAAAQHDGRRTVLQLTSEGAAARDRFRAQQREAFELITADWPRVERLELVRLLLKYTAAADRLAPRRSAAARSARVSGTGGRVTGKAAGAIPGAEVEQP